MGRYSELAAKLRVAGMWDVPKLVPEIATVLEEIDARLAKLEQAAKAKPK